MLGLPSALRLLACRGDHGLLGMRERTSVHRLWSLVEVAAAGVHCSVVESGGSGKPRPPLPLSVERQIGIYHCQVY